MNIIKRNEEKKLRTVVFFENLLVDENNYSHKVKGLSDTIKVSRPSNNPLATQNVGAYFKEVSDEVLKLLPVKDRYAFNSLKHHYKLTDGKTIQLSRLYSSDAIMPGVVGMISVRWTSVIYLSIPSIKDAFPIHLNYNMQVPDCYPYLPTGGLDQLFKRITIHSGISSYLDYVEMADYDKDALPDIVYYNDKSERMVFSGDTAPRDYFAAINELYIQEICKVLLSGKEAFNTVYRQEAFDILRKHIIQSFKTCMVALLKRSMPLVVPSSEDLWVMHCGNTHPRRKFKYENTHGEMISLGFGSVRSEDGTDLTSVEWVEFSVDDQIIIRVLERPVDERTNFRSKVNQVQYSRS